MNQNKIINFPLHKIKNKILDNYTSSPLSSQQKRILIATLLMSVFLVVTIVNTSNVSNPGVVVTQSRSVASVRAPAMASTFEKSVIARYTNEATNSAIHLGQRPSKIEGLAFGELSGSYLISLESGKISAIHVADKRESNYKPQKIRSSHSFLEQYKGVLAISFRNANKTFEKLNSHTKLEEFDLIDAQNQRVGVATFTYDKQGYFISLQIEKQQAVAGL